MRHLREKGFQAWWSSECGATPLAVTLALALALCCGGCGGAVKLAPLSAWHIAESGTLVLDAPRQTVQEACVLALRKQGYAIDTSEPETGLVVTARRPVTGGDSPGAGLFRAYVLEVKDSPGGRAQVSVWPAVSEADPAHGVQSFEAPVWDLSDERASWSRLFKDVRALVEKASP